jgi:hypothetical protein
MLVFVCFIELALAQSNNQAAVAPELSADQGLPPYVDKAVAGPSTTPISQAPAMATPKVVCLFDCHFFVLFANY